MPHVNSQVAYYFDELDDSAKDKAREWMRSIESQDFDPDWTLDDAATVCGLLGVELATHAVTLYGGGVRREPRIHYSGFGFQGDGACFEGTYAHKHGSDDAVRAHAPLDTTLHAIADELVEAQHKALDQLTATVTHSGRYNHERSVGITVYDDGVEVDEETAEVIAEPLRDLMRWIYRQLEQEWEWRLSDRCIDDAIRANEYDFTETGRRAA